MGVGGSVCAIFGSRGVERGGGGGGPFFAASVIELLRLSPSPPPRLKWLETDEEGKESLFATSDLFFSESSL